MSDSNAGGCECVPWKPIDIPICERERGEEHPGAEGSTL